MSAFGDALMLGRSEQERLIRERDELRAEIERLRDLLRQESDRSDTRASRLVQKDTEVERLREERDRFERRVVDYVHALGDSQAEIGRLRTENERLAAQG